MFKIKTTNRCFISGFVCTASRLRAPGTSSCTNCHCSTSVAGPDHRLLEATDAGVLSLHGGPERPRQCEWKFSAVPGDTDEWQWAQLAGARVCVDSEFDVMWSFSAEGLETNIVSHISFVHYSTANTCLSTLDRPTPPTATRSLKLWTYGRSMTSSQRRRVALKSFMRKALRMPSS